MATGKEDLLQSLIEAYLMEKGTREFYAQAASKCSAPDARRTFEELSAWEEKHMDFIQYLYQAVTEDRDTEGFEDFRDKSGAHVAEGGIPVKDLAARLEKVSINDDMEAITMALGIEGKAYAMYWKLSKSAPDSNARVVFRSMMEQEINHISYLKEMMTRISESA
ncbi:MAG: ferritin family protein [Nitrospirae bacterium]|nr:ferritin family protein [Nitrospirota bacterium]